MASQEPTITVFSTISKVRGALTPTCPENNDAFLCFCLLSCSKKRQDVAQKEIINISGLLFALIFVVVSCDMLVQMISTLADFFFPILSFFLFFSVLFFLGKKKKTFSSIPRLPSPSCRILKALVLSLVFL